MDLAGPGSWRERHARLLDRATARLVGRSRVSALLGREGEIGGSGRFARGRHLTAGRFLLGGEWRDVPGSEIWDLPVGDLAEAERQSCNWLDDLAALGDGKARTCAQTWVMGWIQRFGHGTGPGWHPALTGQRVLHWIGQSGLLRRGLAPADDKRLSESLARQVLFLSRRWKGAVPGLPRIQALTGLIQGGVSMQGMGTHAMTGANALARECETSISADGSIPSRNPEELCEILSLLLRATEAMSSTGRDTPTAIRAAIQRIAPTLRSIRMPDGGLARFHGGGRGVDGRLDSALAASGSREKREGLAMGYARLAAGRTTVVMDAAPPPVGVASDRAHASTLAFEMTSGRRPVIVNCGSGQGFGADWAKAGRATASQSTLGIDGFSSSRFGTTDGTRLAESPDRAPGESGVTETGYRFGAAHNGWQRTHGLTHARTLDLTFDGRALTGEELLIALSAEDRAAFDRARTAEREGIAWSVRFHLHPEVSAEVDLGGAAISIALKSGEIWIFRQDGAGEMSLAPSVYLESGNRAPRATTQVVLSGRAMAYATRVRWSLAKAHDTPNALRDLGPGADENED